MKMNTWIMCKSFWSIFTNSKTEQNKMQFLNVTGSFLSVRYISAAGVTQNNRRAFTQQWEQFITAWKRSTRLRTNFMDTTATWFCSRIPSLTPTRSVVSSGPVTGQNRSKPETTTTTGVFSGSVFPPQGKKKKKVIKKGNCTIQTFF